MENKVILVTAIAGDIGNSYAESAHGQEFTLVGCDMEPLACPNARITRFYRIPPAKQAEKYFRAVADIIEKEKVDVVVPISEAEIRVFHGHREIWADWNAKVLINNKAILDNFLDKYRTVEYLNAIGVKVPRTYWLKDFKGQLLYPLVIKQAEGWGSKGIWHVSSDLDIEYFKKKDDGTFLIQEEIGNINEEYTVGVFSDGKKTECITFKRKLDPGGWSKEVTYAESRKMDELARTIARATGLVGSINIQARLSDGEFIVFEINPRFSGTLGFRKKFGFADCLWWPRVSLGGSFKYEKQCKTGRGVRYLSECYVEMDKIA